MKRACLIGYGAIAKTVEQELARHIERVALIGILVRAPGCAGTATVHAHPFFSSVDQVVAAQCDVAVECAGHAALRAIGPACLAAGIDLVVASVGAMADSATEQILRDSAARGGGRLIIPSGAVAGLDGIAAARIAGIERVVYRARKPAKSWLGTAAQQMVDLENITRTSVFFRGNAREACALFPQNANVTAAISLAGIGFENTEVTLEADPEATCNQHQVRVEGRFGTIEILLNVYSLPDNPKSSMLAAYSLVSALLDD